MVLVPGGLTGWLSWKPHAARLSASYTVVRVQLLNVDLGLSGTPVPSDYSVDMEVDALASALDSAGIRLAHFAAWSFGAEVTLSFAARNPGRVRTLTLIEPPAAWVLRARGAFTSALVEHQEKLRTLGPLDVTEDQLAWFSHFAGFVPNGVDPRALPSWPSWVQHRQSLRHGDAPFRHEEDIAKVRSFRKPTLLFKGSGSSPWLNRIIDALGEEMPNASVRELPGGHALHIASMDAFLGMFETFLRAAA